MATTKYYLRKKEQNPIVLEKAATLRNEMSSFLDDLTLAGYEKDVLSKIKEILLDPNNHKTFNDEYFETKPYYIAIRYESGVVHLNGPLGFLNVEDVKAKYEEKKETHELVSIQKENETILAWDVFESKIRPFDSLSGTYQNPLCRMIR